MAGRAAGPAPEAETPELLRDVQEAMRSSQPLPLLALASSLLAATDPDLQSPLERAQGGTPGIVELSELVDSFLATRVPEISALLGTLAELTADDVLRQRIQRELADRAHKPPRWLRRLTPLRIDGIMEMSHVLGDGDNVMIGVTTAADHHLCVVVYIDHNMGTVVKDAFVVDEPLRALAERYEELTATEPGTTFRELDPADARTRIREAIDLGATFVPPFETDTWPSCRPLVEWIVRHLPEGGTGYERPEWSEEELDALAERFLASQHGTAHADDDARDLLHGMFWFAHDYGPGDPLRWSPVSVELLLADFLARKVLLPPEVMRRAPAILRDLIRFAHAEHGIDASLTEQTLQAVVEFRDDYLDQLDRPGSPGIAGLPGLGYDELRTLLEGGGGLGLDEGTWDYTEMMLETLADQVGGEQALDALDATPLPDEPLDLSAVPGDIHERVSTISALVDGGCAELLDVEHRTACRRLLADVAAGDPAIFRRRSKDETAAAAIAWLVAKVNGALTAHRGGLTAQALIGWFGVKGSVSQRAEPMLRAIGIERFSTFGVVLGSPRYLVAAERERIIDRRDRHRPSPQP